MTRDGTSWNAFGLEETGELQLPLNNLCKVELSKGSPLLVSQSSAPRPGLHMDVVVFVELVEGVELRPEHSLARCVVTGLEGVNGPPGLEGVAPRVASVFVAEATIHVEEVAGGHHILLHRVGFKHYPDVGRLTPVDQDVSVLIPLVKCVFVGPVHRSFFCVDGRQNLPGVSHPVNDKILVGIKTQTVHKRYEVRVLVEAGGKDFITTEVHEVVGEVSLKFFQDRAEQRVAI